MSGCGCGKSMFSFDPGSGIPEQSNTPGEASWNNPNTSTGVTGDISNRSPYGPPPSFLGFTFCKKCFLTWAVVFFVIAFFLFRKSN